MFSKVMPILKDSEGIQTIKSVRTTKKGRLFKIMEKVRKACKKVKSEIEGILDR